LRVYPRIKGIQVLNNDGRYLLDSYRRRWIPDSSGNRRQIQRALANWQVFSASNPTQGILEAITRFYDPDKKISVYVFGDDFMRGNVYVESVLRNIDRINGSDGSGERRVRIHGVGFPGTGSDPVRYARFMRAMCERNGGTFVALTEVDAGPRIRIQGPFGRLDPGGARSSVISGLGPRVAAPATAGIRSRYVAESIFKPNEKAWVPPVGPSGRQLPPLTPELPPRNGRWAPDSPGSPPGNRPTSIG
jgi:hypothetical protein